MTGMEGSRLGPLYEHVQEGAVVRGSMLAGIVLTLVAGVVAGQGPGLVAMLPVVLVMALCLVAMHCLRVTATDEELVAAFGPGWIRFRYDLDSIESCEVVQNPWYYGWGIHWIGDGWLLNVSGFEAVELRFRGGGRCRIGSDDAHGLCAFLETQLEARR